MYAVRRGLWAASVAVLAAACAVGADPKKDPPQAPVVAPTKELLDRLLKAYRLYELPEPPADAPLVHFPVHVWAGDHQYHGLGFRLKPVKDGGRVRVFAGAGTIHELERREVAKPVDPRPEALQEIDYSVNELLAAQCHARGWTDLALKALEQARSPDGESPETELAHSAWYYWLDEFRRPETNRAKVARLLKVIWESRREDFTVHDRNKLDSLEASLVPGKAKPGTVEALIDGLIDVTETDQTRGWEGRGMHPNYLKVARLGFEAVPALMEHLNDERLTRAQKRGFNNFRSYDYTVTDVVCDLLQGLAGAELGKDWLRRQQGYRLDKADVEKWWADARKVGEEQYFLTHVLDNERDQRRPNAVMVDVLAHKYPNRLPGIYRKILDERPEMYASAVAKAVAASSLPKETKRNLFLRAAATKVWHHREDAIRHLTEMDPKEGLKALIGALKDFPGDPPDSSEPQALSWTAHWLAYQVIEAKDAQAWVTLTEAALRCPPELQREVIGVMGRPDDETTRAERLRFLSRFLGSGGVWKMAARTAAEVLRLRKPNSEWMNRDWQDLVEDIRTTLARGGIR